jgi:ribosomal protein S18 acetylase RimI-like enzyme
MGGSNDLSFTVRPAGDDDRPWITEHASAVGGEMVVSNGRVHHLAQQHAFVAERDGERLGFFSYRIDAEECEVTAALSLRERGGVGTALLKAVADEARRARCRRLWLVTTNDNLEAIGWYQRRGLRLATVRPGAIDELRSTLKPGIPVIGKHQIPLRDELEFELDLTMRKSGGRDNE